MLLDIYPQKIWPTLALHARNDNVQKYKYASEAWGAALHLIYVQLQAMDGFLQETVGSITRAKLYPSAAFYNTAGLLRRPRTASLADQIDIGPKGTRRQRPSNEKSGNKCGNFLRKIKKPPQMGWLYF